MTPTARLDRWLDDQDADDLPHGVRLASARRLRRLAQRIWDAQRLGEVRYMDTTDLTLIQVVGRIDGLANRLDRPW